MIKHIFCSQLTSIVGNNFVCWGKMRDGNLPKCLHLLAYCRWPNYHSHGRSIVYAVTFWSFDCLWSVFANSSKKTTYNLSCRGLGIASGRFVLLATTARPIGGWLSDKFRWQVSYSSSIILYCIAFDICSLSTHIAVTNYCWVSCIGIYLGCANGAVFALVGKLTRPEAKWEA